MEWRNSYEVKAMEFGNELYISRKKKRKKKVEEGMEKEERRERQRGRKGE